MATPNTSASLESRSHYWLRVLRPLFWWLLLVLILYGIRTHQRLMEQTRLNFTVTLAGQPIYSGATATFDGQPIFSGQKIPLGHHQFTVTHPKGDSYSTNLFVWYGAHNFGKIDLKRTMAILSVTADPPTPALSIHGADFDVELKNSSGMTSSVPTDNYVIMSKYAHWSQSDNVLVSAGKPTTWRIAPRLGAVQINCNEADAAGQLIRADGLVIGSVTFPYFISELPEGTYKVSVQHHRDTRSQKVIVTAGTTNNLSIEFLYGSATFETEPSGASVRTSDGQFLGGTPLTLAELKPGSYSFLLQHNGYDAATATLAITPNQTTSYQTNLVSVNYTASMKIAQQKIDSEDYDNALFAVNNALIAKPGDDDAMELKRKATGLRSLKRAKALGTQGDFFGGEKELATAIQVLPENKDAPALLAEYKRREPEQIEQMRVERLERPKKSFDSTINLITGAIAFESHELTTSKPAVEVQPAIVAQLKSAKPTFQINRSDLTSPTKIFAIEATQVFSGGSRYCVIVGGQSKDDETQIYYTVVESKKVGFMNQPITSLLGSTPLEYTLIDPKQPQLSDKLKNQIAEGVTNVTAIIQSVIGQ